MNELNQHQELLDFFKALSDANRLKIIGLLAQNEYSVEELAALLDLRASTVSHHLNRLSRAGLVSARAEGYYNLYRLEEKALEKKTKQLLSQESLPSFAMEIDMDAYDRKVVRDYLTPDGRLKTIPSQRKKLLAILRYVVQTFELDVRYPESEVNQLLAEFHEDTATLRRELVGNYLMNREKGVYWRLDAEALNPTNLKG